MRATQRVNLRSGAGCVEGLLARVVRAAAGRWGIVPAVFVMGLAGGMPSGYGQTAQPAPAAVVPPAAALQKPAASLEGYPVARVEVEGNTRTDARSILDQVRTQSGQNYSNAAVEQDVRTIASLEKFVTVKAEVIPTPDNRVVVRFVVVERPLVTAVEIRGNRRKSDTQIRELTSVHPGMGVDPFVIQTDMKAIEELYRKDGYGFVHVTFDKELLNKQGIVRYVIEEGPRSRISSIKFEGNANVKSRLLKWKIQTKSYFWIFRKGVVDEDKLDADVATVRDLYIGKGFLDVRVSWALEYSPDKTHITVRFVVNEGPHYRIGTITLSGETVFSEGDLRSDIILKPGDYAERKKIDVSTQHIEDRYGHEGYLEKVITAQSTYADVPAVINLHYEIVEGKAYAVGPVIVRGNPNIQDRVIRRQIRIYPDQTYDTVLVRKSIERLKATRLFGDVKITPIGNDPDSRTALVEVQEGQTGKFLVGAGISTNSGLVGQVSLEQNNFDITNTPHSMSEFLHGQSFKGAGQYFRILLEPGTDVQRYRVTFEEPYLYDTAFSFSNDAYFFTRSRESWDERRYGDIVTLGRRFGDVYSTTLAFRGEDVQITDVKYFGGVPGQAVTLTGENGVPTVLGNSAQEIFDGRGHHLLTSIKPGVVRDTTDSRIFPTTGTRTALSWEQYGAMGGDVDMSKIVGRFDWYYPLYTDIFDRKTVFANRNEVGVIPFGDSPFYERFYAGGIGSLRAFKFRGISPRSGILKDPIGGDLEWLSTGEINYPIYEEIIRGVVFVDVGTVEREIEINQIRSDAGVGLRLTIPFFGQLPLAVDFGLPITKASGDKTQIVSFSLGIPF